MKRIFNWLPKVEMLAISLIAILFLALLLFPGSRELTPPEPEFSSEMTLYSNGPITPLPDSMPNLNPEKVALGKKLFHDPSLSHDNTIACASCHQLERGGVDGVQYSTGIQGNLSRLNAPTVFNSVFNFRQFWNGRAETLQEQVAEPIHNPLEMASNWAEVIRKLKKNQRYVTAFAQIYSTGIQEDNIADAIATFVSSLVTPNSRFDKYLKGEAHAITPYELSGYALFTSYGCISCHQGVNVGGNMYEKLGIMRDYFATQSNITEADKGRFTITQKPEDMYKFKVPGLRNVALTAPYFHNGSAQSLEQAVITMGKYQLGVFIPQEDVSKIVAFLRTLTGEYDGKPL